MIPKRFSNKKKGGEHLQKISSTALEILFLFGADELLGCPAGSDRNESLVSWLITYLWDENNLLI